ncbi:MAG: hypothetical protein C0603_05770 [Denitrovibrio sp.]|nr:MAG: hypothetical protein C0603_05770 [Denitrovibrio sp.]
MNKEVNTFHSGRYLFSAEISADLTVLNEAINVFSRMPIFPDVISNINKNMFEKAIYHEASI